MNVRNALLATAASAAMLTVSWSANAADPIYMDPMLPVAATFDWSGAYIGAHGSYGWGSTRDVNNAAAVSKDLDGFAGGIQAGYNWHSPSNFVFGVEADITLGSFKDSWVDPNEFSGYFTEDKVTASGTLRARLGYAIGQFLPYATGGLAIAHTKHTLGCSPAYVTSVPQAGSCVTDPTGVFETSDSRTSVGYSVGVGAEVAVTDSWTLKAEYLYTDLGRNSVTLVDPRFPALSERRFDTSYNQVRIGVNYRF
jgi:outer membrane immunogenic protein